MPRLRFGQEAWIDIDFGDEVALEQCGAPRGETLADFAGALRAALAEPLELPPLARCTTPGDSVVLALDPQLPQAATAVATIVEDLLAAGVSADGITILRTRGDLATRGDASADWIAPSVAPEHIEAIRRAVHDPSDRRGLAYLAANDDGEPILLNRALHDADVVLPVSAAQRSGAVGNFGLCGSVYPNFSDDKTIHRFRAAEAAADDRATHAKLAAQADQVGWLLGVVFGIQVVPGPNGDVVHVVAGATDAVRRRGRELYRSVWHDKAAAQCDLVIAGVQGGRAQQTWESLGSALSEAMPLVADGGSLVICCELEEEPGPAVQWLASAPSRQAAMRKIAKELPPDTLPAAQLVRAQQAATLYLVSRLSSALVEQLDAIPMQPAEVAEMARHSRSCLLLSNASLADVKLDGR